MEDEDVVVEEAPRRTRMIRTAVSDATLNRIRRSEAQMIINKRLIRSAREEAKTRRLVRSR
jgi:hypothetical protein